MSTRCCIHFHANGNAMPSSIVYRHSDGYPEDVLPDLDRFFSEVENQTTDTRFGDPSYLAAKFVVWQAGERAYPAKPLAFLGVGVVLADPGDIEYRYHLECSYDDARPVVTHEKA